ncbi:MAG: hypothetical protein COB35_11230 [Gammaproteobacteria bacterium]|nr:MAG: hypothetical protein COB35_11230 [Gammaproteobacteria bacterium]
MNFRRFFKAYLSAIIPTLLVILLVYIVDYQSAINSNWQAMKNQQVSAVEAGRLALDADISHVISDVKILASDFNVFDAISSEVKKSLETQFLFFSQNKPRYDQIRYLNNQGIEIIRVDRNLNGYSLLKRKSLLQDKSNRYYFTQASALEKNNVYISSIDWNVENGKIEKPLKPTIRFAMPVFDKQHRRQGVVVVNYLASELMAHFIKASGLHQQQLFLVNKHGELLYLRNKSATSEWILGEVTLFKQLYPDISAQIQREQQGQMQVKQGYYTYTSINSSSSLKDANQQGWLLISQLLRADLASIKQEFKQQRLPIYGVIILLCVIFLFTIIRIRLHHQETLSRNKYEQRFRQILEQLKLAAVTISPEGKLVYANPYFISHLKFENHHVIGQDWQQFFMIANYKNEQQQMSALLAQPAEQQKLEFHIYNGVKQARAFNWSSSYFIDVDGHCYLTLIGDDITEQREIDLERRKLNQAVEQAPVSVMITNLQGKITYVNPNFVELTGYTKEEVLGKAPSFLRADSIIKLHYDDLWQKITAGEVWHGEFCNKKKTGELYWEVASISAVKNYQGENIAYLAVKRDITEERRLTLKLTQENNAKLKNEHDATIGRMAYMISHDLRNPLSSVKMTLQMLPSQLQHIFNSIPCEIKELTEISLTQIAYMEEILTSLLTYAHPDKNKQESVAVEQILANLIQQQRQLDAYKNIDIQYNVIENLPSIIADNTKIHQLLQNLLVNALQAALQTQTEQAQVIVSITVALMEKGEVLMIKIIDNGLGIDPHISDYIFEAFYTTKAKGTGLGLAIVKNIVDHYQGNISLMPYSQGGTCCTVILPTQMRLEKE